MTSQRKREVGRKRTRLAKAVQLLIESYGISRCELARRTGLNQSSVSDFLLGRHALSRHSAERLIGWLWEPESEAEQSSTSPLDAVRSDLRTAEETLDRVRIEVQQSLCDQLRVVRAELQRGDDEIEAALHAGQEVQACELSKIQAERRRRAAVLREIRWRALSAAGGTAKVAGVPGGET